MRNHEFLGGLILILVVALVMWGMYSMGHKVGLLEAHGFRESDGPVCWADDRPYVIVRGELVWLAPAKEE